MNGNYRKCVGITVYKDHKVLLCEFCRVPQRTRRKRLARLHSERCFLCRTRRRKKQLQLMFAVANMHRPYIDCGVPPVSGSHWRGDA